MGEVQRGLLLECGTLLLLCPGTSVNFPLPCSLLYPMGLSTASGPKPKPVCGAGSDSRRQLWGCCSASKGEPAEGMVSTLLPWSRTAQSSANERQRRKGMRWGCQGRDIGGRKWQKELRAGAQSLGLAIDPSLGLNLPNCKIKRLE